MWHLIETSGPNPGAISHHSSVVYNERMYLFGGSKANGEENKKFYSLDLKSYKWEVISSVRQNQILMNILLERISPRNQR